MPINPNMELWLTELETTDKPQAIEALYFKGGFCCLGIACEVAIENGVEVAGGRDEEYGFGGNGPHYMPEVVADWLGLTPMQQRRCARMNDNEQLTFPEIAAVLRKELA